ncbi:MAG: hypothetical protein QOF84_2005, partial [Streptomyces sp.]|nr:hypothetical protein [Streptomyces sp.]
DRHPAENPTSRPAPSTWIRPLTPWINPKQGRWAVLLTNKIRLTRDRQPLTDVRNAVRALTFN